MTKEQSEELSSQTLIDVFEKHVADRPDASCFHMLNADISIAEQLTYVQLHKRVLNFAASLQKRDLFNKPVLLLLPSGTDYLVAFLGCVFAGAIAVTSYPPRPNRSSDRMMHILNDVQPSLVIVDQAAREYVRENIPLRTELQLAVPDELLATDLISTGMWQRPEITPQQIAYLQYSSGSTSDPKGVMVSHENILANCHAITTAIPANKQTRMLSWLPLFHDMGLIGGLLTPVFQGFSVYLMQPDAFLMRPKRWLQALTKYRAHWTVAPNFAYQLCVDKVSDEIVSELDLSCLNAAWVGAEPVRPATLKVFARKFSASGFSASVFYPCYGMAESTLLISGGDWQTEPLVALQTAPELQLCSLDESDHESMKKPGISPIVSCGKAWSGHEIRIVNPKTWELQPDGQVGEIWFSGPSVASGYWQKPSATEQTFVHKAFNGVPERYLRTGDLGIRYQGELFVSGRIKNLIILAGRNLFGEDLELAVEQSSDQLIKGGCAALSVDEEGSERLVIIAELKRRKKLMHIFEQRAEAHDMIEASIRRALSVNFDVKADDIVLLGNKKIPRTSSGKIQRAKCRQQYLSGAFSST